MEQILNHNDGEKREKRKKKRNNRSKKISQQKIALTRIDTLFNTAPKLFKLKKEYANNCVRLARKISLRYKVSFTKEQKILFCKKCESYLAPNKTSRVRVSRGKIVVLCLNCKKISRYFYK